MPKTRKDKLIMLREMVDLESGAINEAAFDYENSLYEKSIQKKSLDFRITACHLCEGLNITRFTDNCPGWGDLNAKIFFIGQSLHKPGIVSDLPFILGSGYYIDAALRLSSLLRKDAFFSNVLHCHPPRNRISTERERKTCVGFLLSEIQLVKPELLVALGNDAQWAIQFLFSAAISRKETSFRLLKIRHPASFLHSAPEDSIEWILKLSKEIDKVYK